MQDKSVARQVAPDGSRLGIMPTTSGGVATQPRAPGHERPFTASSGAAKHGRLSAATRAPGADIPLATTAGAPGHGRPLAASSGAAGHDRPRATPRAPGADVPLATTAGVPGQRCPSAAHWARDHFRSRPAPTAPGHDRPLAASSGATRHDRPRATLQAPVQDVPRALAVRVPGSDRPCALAATAAAPDGPMSCTRCRVPIAPIADPTPGHAQPPSPTPPRRPTTCTAGHIPPRRCNSSPKPTGRRCSMPRPACSRFLLSASWPRGTLSRGASTTVGSALDVLRPLLEDRQALATGSKSAPFRLLDDAAHFTDDPTTCMTRKEHHPVICRYFIP